LKERLLYPKLRNTKGLLKAMHWFERFLACLTHDQKQKDEDNNRKQIEILEAYLRELCSEENKKAPEKEKEE
jgi:hypothetical protein